MTEQIKSASNCVSQSDPNCTPLPMGVQPAQHVTRIGPINEEAILRALEDDDAAPYLPTETHTSKTLGVAPPETPAAAQQEPRWPKDWKPVSPELLADAREYVQTTWRTEGRLSEFVAYFASVIAAERVAAAESRLVEATRAFQRTAATVRFFASVVKSGESWSVTCQESLEQMQNDSRALSEVGAAPSQTQKCANCQGLGIVFDHVADENGHPCTKCNGVTPSAPNSAQLPTGVRAEDVREWRKLLLIADSYLSLLRHRGGITTWGALGMTTERELDAVIGKLRRAYEPTAPPQAEPK